MNILKGEIESVIVYGSLSLVKAKVGAVRLSAIVIDTPESAPYLKKGSSIRVIFKETEVIIGKGSVHKVSLQNQVLGTIQAIDSDKLLSRLTLDTEAGTLISVITTQAVGQLDLNVGEQVTAMVKTNEIMLADD